MSTAIMLLKLASAARAGKALGTALQATGRGVRGAVGASGELGAGIAGVLGGNEAVGRAAGVSALGATAYYGGKKGKRKLDEWKYRHNFGGG
jgi:hypothetical protein